MEQGQSIFVGNIKGGVGKSTITAFLYDYFRTCFPKRSIQMLDTDRQGTSFELLGSVADERIFVMFPLVTGLMVLVLLR